MVSTGGIRWYSIGIRCGIDKSAVASVLDRARFHGRDEGDGMFASLLGPRSRLVVCRTDGAGAPTPPDAARPTQRLLVSGAQLGVQQAVRPALEDEAQQPHLVQEASQLRHRVPAADQPDDGRYYIQRDGQREDGDDLLEGAVVVEELLVDGVAEQTSLLLLLCPDQLLLDPMSRHACVGEQSRRGQ